MTVAKRLDGSIVSKDEDERFILGPVLIPDRPDQAGDVVSRENIAKVAHKFTEEYQNLDLMHTFESVAKLSESFIARQDLSFGETTVPKGSWLLGVRVEDDKVWSQIKRGDLTGFSIYGQGSRSPHSGEDVSASKTQGESEEEEETVAKSASGETIAQNQLDLDRVTFVSLVDEPEVGDSEYVVMKRDGSDVPTALAECAANVEDVAKAGEESGSDAPDDAVEKRLFAIEKKLDRLGESGSIATAGVSGDDATVAKAREKTTEDGTVDLTATIEAAHADESDDVEKRGLPKGGSPEDVEKLLSGDGSGDNTVGLTEQIKRDSDRSTVEQRLAAIEQEVDTDGVDRKGAATSLDRELVEAEESNRSIGKGDGTIGVREQVEKDLETEAAD